MKPLLRLFMAEAMAMRVRVKAVDAIGNTASDLITVYKKHDGR